MIGVAVRARYLLTRALQLAAALGLAACMGAEGDMETGAGPPTWRLGADFGNAVSHNAAQHIIDPMPAYRLKGAPDMDGARAAEAIKRYRRGAVLVPEAVETSDFGETR